MIRIRNSGLLTLFAATFYFSSAHAALPVWEDAIEALPETPEATPDFTDKQNYLGPAPVGVGAREAWSLPGGKGENVKIIDVETGFEKLHEDLGNYFYMGADPDLFNQHGTAVLGIIRGAENDFGVTGIAKAAQLGFHGFAEGALDNVDESYIKGINTAISGATSQLEPGDVLVIEQHMLGPDSGKYTAVEYWDEIFKTLKAATDKGIICVEAAGNGNSDFDSEIYKGAFDLKVRDSGCILVGAGEMGTHERLSFSNYGSRIDAHGYGGKVVSTGYGDLFNGSSTRMYTARFSGTSSATPIVAGAIALTSSIARQHGRILTPAEVREALRATGTPQGPETESQRIGSFPDVTAMLRYFRISR